MTMEVSIPFLEKLVDAVVDFFKKDRRKPLPQKDVVIGSYDKQDLTVAICADIELDETTQPDVEIFLRRLHGGIPYCPHCSRPLDHWNASWMADYGQIGYQCRDCETQIKGDHENLRNELRREVRKDFPAYWTRYQEAIRRLTRGRPRKFKPA